MASDIALKIDNRYDVLGELGRGGMGVVYKANDVKMDRLVAIKVMTTHAPGRDEYQERFLREARSIAKMQHPNIVVVYDYGYHAGAPYMAMEYVEGIALDRVIASRVSLTPLAKVNYIIQVCHALHYAHQQGIIHRDVKPGNIMLLDGGKRVKLLDFGIARAGAASNLSKSGLAMGTTCYMSPEQTKGQRDLDGRADIFSAGVVLYELLAGKQPWSGDSDYEIMTKIIHDPFPPLAGSSNYPAALDQILERALAKDASARYPTAEKMAQELGELEAPLKERALEEAIVQFENGDLLRARDLVSQILRVDTRHREANELQSKLHQVVQLQQRSEQVRQLRAAAEQAIGEKRYTEALSSIERAISLDSANTELFHYRELIRNEVKRREDIRKKLALAERAEEINDLSTAQELVEKALEVDPTDTHARTMKSRLEQERKRQQQQELSDEASRALAVRAFDRAKELIQQLEALDPSFPPVSSFKKSLLEAEAEERRRVEIEDLVQEIRRILESGNVSQSLAATEKALGRFPSEPRLVRFRAQAETLRDAAERERALREQISLVRKLAEEGRNAEALASAEGALKQLGSDPRLQALLPQLRQVVERERQTQAQQSILAQAQSAIQVSDFESAIKILAAARIDFPNSQEIADTLQAAQTANAQKADALERERRLQAEQQVLTQARNAMRALDFDSAVKILSAARFDFPNSQSIADALQAAQAASAQKADAVERERRLQAEQQVLTQARNAMRASNFESAIKILGAARIDFPNSQDIADALQTAQAASAQKDDTVKRERQVQAEQTALAQARKAMQQSDFESAVKILAAAQIDFPNSQDIANALQAARTAGAQKADKVKRERQVQAEQAALAQARKAMQQADFESALKTLAAARIDFPNSKDVADALQAAQAASAKKAEENAEIARKREIAESLERAIANESDPELQVRLAEEAVRRMAGNDAAERVLSRVRDRHRQISSAVDRANKFEHAQRYKEAIQEWERVRQLWPQCPQLGAQVARLNAALKAPSKATAPPAAPPSPVRDFSATSIMAAAPKAAPDRPSIQAVPPVEAVPQTASLEGTRKPVASTIEVDRSRPGLRLPDVVQSLLQSKKVLLAIAGAATVVVLITVLYFALRTNPKPQPKPMLVESPRPATTPPSVAPLPVMGQLTIRTNVNDTDILVDGVFKAGTGGREQTIPVVAGTHKITVKAQGYDTPIEQQVEVAKDHVSTLQFTLLKATGNAREPEPDTYLIFKSTPGAKVRIDGNTAEDVQPDGDFSLKTNPGSHQVELSLTGYQPLSKTVTVKAGNRRPIEMPLSPKPAPAIVSFDPSPSSIQEGESVELKWATKNATGVTIDGVGDFPATSSTRVTPKETGTVTYTLHTIGDGAPARKTVTVNIAALLRPPVIRRFEAGARKIQLGDSVKLFWSTQNGEASIGPDLGKVDAEASTEVTPTKPGVAVYTLTVKGQGGTPETKTAQVVVEAPAPAVGSQPQPASTPLADNPEILAVLSTVTRYQDAFETLDLGGIKKVMDMPGKTEDALKSVFKSVRGIKLNQHCDKPIISGDSAECTCTQAPLYIYDNDRKTSPRHKVLFKFKKIGDIWRIVSLQGLS